MKIGRVFRRALEKALGRWKEGPTPPGRMEWALEEFRTQNPDAGGEQWLEVARVAVRDAYAEGFIRGLEIVVRDPHAFDADPLPEPPKEATLEELRTRFDRDRDPGDPCRGVPPEHRAMMLDLLAQSQGGAGGFRLVKLPGKEGE